MPRPSTLIVSKTVSKNPDPHIGVKPAHWVDNVGTSFRNPWESYRHHTIMNMLSFVSKYPSILIRDTRKIAQCLSVRKPTWGESLQPESEDLPPTSEKMKATWLGHACFLVEFPSRTMEDSSLKSSEQRYLRGVRILFDPVFSDRCSPNQYFGPKRYTPPPCTIDQIPEVDAVIISVSGPFLPKAKLTSVKHNHYDHLDTQTILTLFRRTTRTPHFFAPLGNLSFFQKLGVPETNIHIMDWWDSKRLEVSFGRGADAVGPNTNDFDTTRVVNITCTPSQHFTGRTLWDQFQTLWASWVVEETMISDAAPARRSPMKVYFAGDTAYRTVLEGEDEDKVPVCPAFEQIGDTFGGFDFAMIPIGAYLPREFTSRVHCAPQDSVRIFKDIKAKKAIGMHWGTWVLTMEDVTDPPRRLAEVCKKLEIEDDAFSTCDIGETVSLYSAT